MNTLKARIWMTIPLMLAFALQVLAPATAAAEAAKPGWYTDIVDYDFVKGYAVIPTRSDVVIVDSRPTARRYDAGHIPGAINIPESQFEGKAASLLPADKSTLLIFYCGGEKCMLSHKSAYAAEALGHTNIKVYAAGEPDWRAQGELMAVSPAFVKKQLDSGKPLTLVDSRPKARKFDKGHLPGAVSLPDREFETLAADVLPADKAVPLVFYCGGLQCKLSSNSAEKALALGYTNVKVMPEGYPAWVQAYGAGETATAPTKVSINTAGEAGIISIDSFTEIVEQSPDSIYIIDVRDPEEFANGSFKTAINMPINDFEGQIDNLPIDKPIVFICGSGGRSGEAYDMVQMFREGLEVYFLDAGLTFNPDGSYLIEAHPA